MLVHRPVCRTEQRFSHSHCHDTHDTIWHARLASSTTESPSRVVHRRQDIVHGELGWLLIPEYLASHLNLGVMLTAPENLLSSTTTAARWFMHDSRRALEGIFYEVASSFSSEYTLQRLCKVVSNSYTRCAAVSGRLRRFRNAAEAHPVHENAPPLF